MHIRINVYTYIHTSCIDYIPSTCDSKCCHSKRNFCPGLSAFLVTLAPKISPFHSSHPRAPGTSHAACPSRACKRCGLWYLAIAPISRISFSGETVAFQSPPEIFGHILVQKREGKEHATNYCSRIVGKSLHS